MRIDSAKTEMGSARTYRVTESTVRKTSAGIYYGMGSFAGLLDAGTPKDGENLSEETEDQVSGTEERSAGDIFADHMKTMRSRIEEIKAGKAGYNAYSEDSREQMRKFREACLELLLWLIFPRMRHDLSNPFVSSSESFDAFGLSTGKSLVVSQSTEYYYEETEETEFTAAGCAVTEDGRTIDFQLNLKMSREFREYYSEEIVQMQAALCDPLVINLEGEVPELMDQTFCFDIDSDGVEDEISRLVAGSGFLALDQNEDGVINDGSELFGTKSGNGFRDLASFDTDGNGFIDEGDEVFDKLKIWAMDEEGKMQLYSLKDKNVGAVGLMHASTEFSLNDLADNRTKGVIRNTGIFLYEDGKVGTVQQMDLARREKLAAYA